MDLLIAEPLEAEVLDWLDARHELFYAPRLAQDHAMLKDTLAQARAILLPPQLPIDAATLAAAPRLRAIGRIVGGHENIDLTACTRAGVEVVRNVDATAPAEAEFILGALLTLLRPSPEETGHAAGRELGTSCVGLIGMTPSARHLARLLRAMGSRVIGYDPGLHASDGQWARWGVQPVGLRELFEQSDAVASLLPYFSRYHGLLGERTLGCAKRGQVLVSLSPLDVFDIEVLADVLRSRRLVAAWMDHIGVGAFEPGVTLRNLPGLMITPRLASYTREARVRSAWGVARRVDEILRTQPALARYGSRRNAPPTEAERPLQPSASPLRAATLAAAGVMPESQPGRFSTDQDTGASALSALDAEPLQRSRPRDTAERRRINPAG